MAFDPSIVADSQKIKLTLSSAAITSDQIDFPLAVALNGTNPLHDALFADLDANSKKLSIELSGTQLPVEIEHWDATGKKALLHAKVPTYVHSADTELILTYDSTQDDNSGYVGDTGSAVAQSVWNSGYAAVYHMAQDPSAGGACILDSTGNANHGTPSGSMTSGDLVDGLIGKALDFDGSDDKISIPDSASLDITQALTTEVFCYTTATSKNMGLLTKCQFINNWGTNAYSVKYDTLNNSSVMLLNSTPVYDNSGGISANQWVSATHSYNKSQIIPYISGVQNGTPTAYTADITTNNYGLIIGAYFGGYYFQGKISEVRISSVARSADWIKLSHLSMMDQLITWSAVAAVLLKSLSQPYTIYLGDILTSATEQPYGISTNIDETYLEQLYSMVLEIWLTQFYGDVSIIAKSLEQPYAGAKVLNKSLQQKWGHALEIETSLLQDLSMPETFETFSDQQYGIAAEVLNLTCEQLYHINANSTLLSGLIQPYALAGELSKRYSVTTKLYIDDIQVEFAALEWQFTESEVAGYCSFTPLNKSVALICKEGSIIRINHLDEDYYFKCYSGWMVSKAHTDETFNIEAYSKTMDLEGTQTLTGNIYGGLASEVIKSITEPLGVLVEWLMVDGYIFTEKLSGNNKTPMEFIRDIVAEAGGIMQSTISGDLLIVAAEETSIPDYPICQVAEKINIQLSAITTSESPDEQLGYNFFKISDLDASVNNGIPEYIDINPTTREVRFFVDKYDNNQYLLGHTGDNSVTIEPFGLVEIVFPDEIVEFIDGYGQTTKPIHSIISFDWQENDLGTIAIDTESPSIKSEQVGGYSLLKLTYKSKYWKWIVKSTLFDDVQFIVYEVLS